MSEEERLIAAASRGDADAFEKLVRSRQEKVFWTAYQVVGHIEDARDVAQHVFLRLWQAGAGRRALSCRRPTAWNRSPRQPPEHPDRNCAGGRSSRYSAPWPGACRRSSAPSSSSKK